MSLPCNKLSHLPLLTVGRDIDLLLSRVIDSNIPIPDTTSLCRFLDQPCAREFECLINILYFFISVFEANTKINMDDEG